METTAETQTTVQHLLDAALNVLRASPGIPISLASLGQKIVAQTGTPIRQVLGARPLGIFLENELNGQVEFEGVGSERKILLATDSQSGSGRWKYDPSVFSAFAKAIASDRRRWLIVERPLRFTDSQVEKKSENAFEIEERWLVGRELNGAERAEAVENSIEKWCEEKGVDPHALRYIPVQPSRSRIENVERAEVQALRALIAAIPVSERRNYNLSMDLLGRLLGL